MAYTTEINFLVAPETEQSMIRMPSGLVLLRPVPVASYSCLVMMSSCGLPFLLANPWCLWVSKFSLIRTWSDWIGAHPNGLILI